MHLSSRKALWAAALGAALALSGPALADSVRVHAGPGGARIGVRAGGDHVGVRFGGHVDRFHRVPPEFRGRGFRAGPGVTMRVSPFRGYRGWHVNRFNSAQLARWRGGRWWHGWHHGHVGWWWWVDGGWYFYDAPIYPYPGYVSDYAYDEPSQDYGDYWYYCRDPEGYYPYVQHCNGNWEPVPAQPSDGYAGQGGSGPGDQQMEPDDQGPSDQGGPPDDQGPPDEGGPDDYGPPPPPPHG